MINEFRFNKVPVLNDEHKYLLELIRGETIDAVRSHYPSAYQKREGVYEYTAKDRPALKGNVDDLLKKLGEEIFTQERVEQLQRFEMELRPRLENHGFQMILRYVLPSVMGVGPRSDLVRISGQGTARCLDCFEEKLRQTDDTSGVGYFKIHKKRNIEVAIAPINEIVGNEDLVAKLMALLPTDVRLEEDKALLQRFTPEFCLAQKTPNYHHQRIIPLSTVIVLEYWNKEKEARVIGSNVLHMRDKSGPEMLRKLMLYFIGQSQDVTDGIGSRSIVPDDYFAEVLGRAVRDYPYRGPLNGAIVAANYTQRDLKRLLTEAAELPKDLKSFLVRILREVTIDDKPIIINEKTNERGKDIEFMGRFGNGDEDLFFGNVIKHMLYRDKDYSRMNGTKGYDAFEYQLRRFSGMREYYTTAHWKIYHLIRSIAYHHKYRDYIGRMAEEGLKRAVEFDRNRAAK